MSSRRARRPARRSPSRALRSAEARSSGRRRIGRVRAFVRTATGPTARASGTAPRTAARPRFGALLLTTCAISFFDHVCLEREGSDDAVEFEEQAARVTCK